MAALLLPLTLKFHWWVSSLRQQLTERQPEMSILECWTPSLKSWLTHSGQTRLQCLLACTLHAGMRLCRHLSAWHRQMDCSCACVRVCADFSALLRERSPLHSVQLSSAHSLSHSFTLSGQWKVSERVLMITHQHHTCCCSSAHGVTSGSPRRKCHCKSATLRDDTQS